MNQNEQSSTKEQLARQALADLLAKQGDLSLFKVEHGTATVRTEALAEFARRNNAGWSISSEGKEPT